MHVVQASACGLEAGSVACLDLEERRVVEVPLGVLGARIGERALEELDLVAGRVGAHGLATCRRRRRTRVPSAASTMAPITAGVTHRIVSRPPAGGDKRIEVP